jgi:hypothetical protein
MVKPTYLIEMLKKHLHHVAVQVPSSGRTKYQIKKKNCLKKAVIYKVLWSAADTLLKLVKYKRPFILLYLINVNYEAVTDRRTI